MNNKSDCLYIIGCGGHARSILDVIMNNNDSREIILIDANARMNEEILGYKVQKSVNNFNGEFFIGTGDNLERKRLYEHYFLSIYSSIISKDAYLGRDVIIHKGSFIGHRAILNTQVSVGENTIINTGAVVEHEVKIGKHSHVSSNATILGRAKIGDCVLIGGGSVVNPGVTICSNVMIGSSSVVIDSIIEPGVYVGSPVRRIK